MRSLSLSVAVAALIFAHVLGSATGRPAADSFGVKLSAHAASAVDSPLP